MHSTSPVLKNERVSKNWTFGCSPPPPKKNAILYVSGSVFEYRTKSVFESWPDYLNYILSRRFDLHDTEDCPTQSMQQQQEELEETDSPNKSLGGHTRSGGVRGASRSYCDKCEVFGHETSTCDVADSY